jgi:hypothetical protein
VTVTLEDDEPNGLASMLARLLRSNLERDRRRGTLLRPAIFDLAAADAGVAARIETTRGEVRVRNGIDPAGAHVAVTADSADLLLLASVPLRWGVPDPLTPEGRTVLGHVVRGRIRVEGLVRHPMRLSRLARLLSAA